LSLQPESAEAHINLGIALADHYDLQGALEQFSDAVRLDPKSSSAHYNMGRGLFDMGRNQEAYREATQADQLSQNNTSVLFLLALIERQTPDYGKAAAYLRRLLLLKPEDSTAEYMLGQTLLQMGDTSSAIQHWKLAVRIDPQNSEALYNLARTLNRMGDPESKVYLERAQDLQKQRQLSDRVQTLNNFALQAANEHNWPQAFAQLDEAVKLCGHCGQLPTLHKNLGLLYARTGKVKEGEQELRLALKLDSHNEDAENALKILRTLSANAGWNN
jgi:tetratricopeptide (TPR) repeat protein